MKSKILVIIIVLAVFAVGLFFVFGNKSPEDSSDETSIISEVFTGSLKEAVSLGVPMKCKYTVAGVEYEGVVKGNQYKGSIVNPDGTSGTVIMKENCVYTWEEGQDQGIKVCYDIEEGDIWDSEDTEAIHESYVCNPAAVSDAEFDLPADVSFLDMDSFMQEIQSTYGIEGVQTE